MSDDNQVFFYVHGDPGNGQWVDMAGVDSEDEVIAELMESGLIPDDYEDDVWAGDTDGLCQYFAKPDGSFNYGEFSECRDCDGNDDEKMAYMEWTGYWSSSEYLDCRYGEHNSELDFATQFADDNLLHEVPENLRYYFDYNAFADDLFQTDFHFQDGFVFRC